jgi:hypothetical protein
MGVSDFLERSRRFAPTGGTRVSDQGVNHSIPNHLHADDVCSVSAFLWGRTCDVFGKSFGSDDSDALEITLSGMVSPLERSTRRTLLRLTANSCRSI